MEFDIIDGRGDGCVTMFSVCGSTLQFDLVELDCRRQSSRRGGLWLIIGVRFSALTGVRHAQHQRSDGPERHHPQRFHDVAAYDGDDW